MAAVDFPSLMHNCFLHELFSAIWRLLHESVVSDAGWPQWSFSRAQRDVSMKKSLFWHGPPQPHSGLSLFPSELPFFGLSYSSSSVFFSQCFSLSPSERVWFRALFIAGLLGSEIFHRIHLAFFQMLCFFLVLLVSLQLSEDSAHSKTRKVTAAYRPDASHFKMAYFYLHWLFDSFSFMHLQKDLNSSLTHNHVYVCVSMTPGVSVCVPCVSEIMRKFPSLFWEYTLHKLLLKQL